MLQYAIKYLYNNIIAIVLYNVLVSLLSSIFRKFNASAPKSVFQGIFLWLESIV